MKNIFLALVLVSGLSFAGDIVKPNQGDNIQSSLIGQIIDTINGMLEIKIQIKPLSHTLRIDKDGNLLSSTDDSVVSNTTFNTTNNKYVIDLSKTEYANIPGVQVTQTYTTNSSSFAYGNFFGHQYTSDVSNHTFSLTFKDYGGASTSGHTRIPFSITFHKQGTDIENSYKTIRELLVEAGLTFLAVTP